MAIGRQIFLHARLLCMADDVEPFSTISFRDGFDLQCGDLGSKCDTYHDVIHASELAMIVALKGGAVSIDRPLCSPDNFRSQKIMTRFSSLVQGEIYNTSYSDRMSVSS